MSVLPTAEQGQIMYLPFHTLIANNQIIKVKDGKPLWASGKWTEGCGDCYDIGDSTTGVQVLETTRKGYLQKYYRGNDLRRNPVIHDWVTEKTSKLTMKNN